MLHEMTVGTFLIMFHEAVEDCLMFVQGGFRTARHIQRCGRGQEDQIHGAAEELQHLLIAEIFENTEMELMIVLHKALREIGARACGIHILPGFRQLPEQFVIAL